MNLFLRLRAWQLFALLFGLPLLIQLLAGVALALTKDFLFFAAGLLLAMLLFCLFFGWLWTLGTRLTALLPATVPNRGGRFKAALLLPVGYLGALLVLLTLLFQTQAFPNLSPAAPLLILPLHLLSMAGIFYALYFVAKTLKAVELQRPVEIGDYLGDFFLLWFFPVGLWIIQPRINQLFAKV
jgi:hypothetical protein